MKRKQLRSNVLAACVVFALFLVAAGSADGHTVGISRGDYRVLGADVTTDLVFARPEVAGAIPGLDVNHDGTLSQSEVDAGRAAIENAFILGLGVRSQADSCRGVLQDAALTEEDGVLIRAVFHCKAEVETVTFNLNFLAALSHGHRHLAAATAGSTTAHAAAYAGNSEFKVTVLRGSNVVAATWTDAVWPLFCLGIEHILTGYDHLVFLLGLILISNRVRPLLLVITAFTVAHSITLGVSTLQLWSPGTRFVEPAIALSIAYIGVENWFVKDVSRRWLITFPFGLIHGFGFAGALRQISLPHKEIPLALLSFNVGVEAGQFAVLIVTLPVIFWLRRHRWFLDRGVHAVSGAIAFAGILWFLVRVS
jgi:hydrogenase/urease accessory protein HupE